MEPRKLLMVLYEFPPEGSRGTKRSMKYIKYMMPFGYIPIILTVETPNLAFFDSTLFAELPKNLSIYRAYTLENLFVSKTSTATTDKNPEKRMSRIIYDKIKSWVKNIYHGIGDIIAVLDSHILWLPFALLKGRKAIKKENIDIIYSSGPSHTNHLVALLLKKISGRNLVVDFRDAWVANPVFRHKYQWQFSFARYLEKSVILNADKVISTTEGMNSDFKERYGNSNGKFITITNGYDTDDIKDILHTNTGNNILPFKIVHAGTLGKERSPKKFLKAVSELSMQMPEIKEGIRVNFVGQNRPFYDGKKIEDYINEGKLDEFVVLSGFVSRKKSIEYMADANLLLLIIGEVATKDRYKYGISGKIYDYALTGKPIMVISKEGSTADMARYLGIECVIDPDDTEKIKEWLKKYYTLFINKQYSEASTVNRERLEQFDFKNLTKVLVDQFDVIMRK